MKAPSPAAAFEFAAAYQTHRGLPPLAGLATAAISRENMGAASGLFNMMRGGSANTSNKLMQMRVLLQFIALVLILLAVYFNRG